MIGHHSVIRLARIKVLNQMIHTRPLPNDFAARGPGGSGFDDMRHPQAIGTNEVRIGAGGDGLLRRLVLP